MRWHRCVLEGMVGRLLYCNSKCAEISSYFFQSGWSKTEMNIYIIFRLALREWGNETITQLWWGFILSFPTFRATQFWMRSITARGHAGTFLAVHAGDQPSFKAQLDRRFLTVVKRPCKSRYVDDTHISLHEICVYCISVTLKHVRMKQGRYYWCYMWMYLFIWYMIVFVPLSL